MTPKRLTIDEKVVSLLQHLLVIELWRGGLSQAEIRARLGISIGTVNKMLKGVERFVETRSK